MCECVCPVCMCIHVYILKHLDEGKDDKRLPKYTPIVTIMVVKIIIEFNLSLLSLQDL